MIAYITGASSGLGAYTAQALADNGWTVVAGARSFTGETDPIALVCRTEQFGSGTNRSSSNISQSGGKNNNILIIGQYHLSSLFWQVYCELKHVSELIRLIAFTGMAVCTHIGNFSIFQITFRMSGVPPLTDDAKVPAPAWHFPEFLTFVLGF